MSEHARHLGTGTYCAYCGEYQIGAEAKKVKYLNFESWYPDEENMVIDPAKPLSGQIVDFVSKYGPEPVEALQCPLCDALADEEDLFTGEMWQCVDCEEVHEDEKFAENCCSYQREYQQRNEAYAHKERQRMIEDAKRLLAEEGFSVAKENGPIISASYVEDELARIARGLP